MDWTLEVVVVPVGDVDRARAELLERGVAAGDIDVIEARADKPLIPR